MPAVSQRAYTLVVSDTRDGAFEIEIFTTQKAQRARAREIIAELMHETGAKRCGSLRSGQVSVAHTVVLLATYTEPGAVRRFLLAKERKESARNG